MSFGHMDVIENSILTTLSLYGAMGIPMAPLEIYRNLVIPCQERESRMIASLSFCGFLNILESSEIIKQKTEKFNAMYFCGGGKFSALMGEGADIYNRRQLNYRLAIKKWIILRRFACFFEAVPFGQAVFASGSLTRNNTSQLSDIDLLIIGERNRLWIARAFAVSIAKIIGRHRSGKKVADMFCLNHFVSDKDLEIKHKSIYTAELYSKLVPIFSREGFGGENILINFRDRNQWVKEYLPVSYGAAPNSLRRFSGGFVFRLIRYCLEFILSGKIGNFFEIIARKLQEPRIKKDSRKPDGRVIFSDSEIELHPNSPERRVIDELNEKLRELGIEREFEDSGLL